jgi:SAM-dependent methyltransferase
LTVTSTINSHAISAEFEFSALSGAPNYRSSLVREFNSVLQGRVLEIGVGIGQMTAEFAKAPGISELFGVEPDTRFHNAFILNNPDIELIRGLAEDLPSEPGWDGLVAVNVLEHIEDDSGELRNWARLLARRRGRVGVLVPARPEIFAPIDRDFGHFRRFTRPELRQKMTSAGFKVERLYYFNLIGYFGWWLFFRLLRRRNFNAGLVKLFDRCIFPIGHKLESTVCRPPFGQSLLAIGRARG